MPQIRQYPQATTLLPDDAFIIDRVTVGSMYIDAGNVFTTGSAITYVIDGAGATFNTGTVGALWIPFSCTILANTLLADQTGSVVVDIWKTTYGAYNPPTAPTSANSICASALPTITSANKSTDAILTGWTTQINAGDTLTFHVNSVSTITRLTVVLQVTT